MEFYDKLATTASRLINKYGQSVFLVRPDKTIDPITGVDSSGVDRNYKLTGLLKRYPDNLIDGTRIKASDRLMIMDGNFEPALDDQLTINCQNWSVESIQTSNPAGTALVYFVQVRK